MHIRFECSGGYLNLLLKYQADTDELPAELADELVSLVESCGFFSFQQSPDSPAFPDMISYSLFISDGNRSRSLSVNDASAGSLHPLLGRLRQLALEEHQKGR
jgi:hypothetical protein